MGIECEAQPCPPAAFPQPEPHCHLGLREGTVQLAPSSRPNSPRLLESCCHCLLTPSAELTHCLVGTRWSRGITAAAPGMHLARGDAGGEPRNDATSLHLKQTKKNPPRDALIFATTDSHYRLLGHGAGPGSAGSDGPGSGGETLKTRTDWKLSALVPAAYQRLEAGAQGRGTPLQSYPSSFNEPHGAELVPSPTQATGASAQRIVTVLACTVLMYQKTL